MIKYPASMWYGMKSRCSPGLAQNKRSNYHGCSIAFTGIDEFKAWAIEQPGYDCFDEHGNRYHLDKDLICPGNKIYGPDFCALVPARINTLMLDCGSKETTGASFHKATGKWQSRVQTPEGRLYLGLFDTKQLASYVWKSHKAAVIKNSMAWYRSQDGFDVRVYESLMRQAYLLGEN